LLVLQFNGRLDGAAEPVPQPRRRHGLPERGPVMEVLLIAIAVVVLFLMFRNLRGRAAR